MAKIVMYFTLPALIFSTLARNGIHEGYSFQTYLATYAIGSVLTMLIGVFIQF